MKAEQAHDLYCRAAGELYQRYREGREDQLSALGRVVNMIVLRNTLYMDAVLNQLRTEGSPVGPENPIPVANMGMLRAPVNSSSA